MRAVLLFACGFLLGLSTCQRQGESREATSNSVQQPPGSLNDDVQQRQELASNAQQERQRLHQDSEIVEYYDSEEYYDEPAPSEGAREPKLSRPADEEASTRVNGTIYDDDSYYYDDDYEEEEEGTATAVNGTELTQHLENKLELTQESKSKVIPNKEEGEEKKVETEEVEPVHEEEERQSEEPIDQTSVINDTRIEVDGLQSPKNVTDPSKKDSILIGEAIVSVVTTKSVVNGTYSLPETTMSPTSASAFNASTIEPISESPDTTTTSTTSTTSTTTIATTTTATINATTAAPVTTTTENVTSTTEFTPSSTIQPAVPTSRSVSGARFLPFPSVDKVEQLDSTESIIDKLDRVQSELSSGFLANGRFVPRRYSKKPFSITSLTLPSTSTAAPTASPIAPITITSLTKRPRVQTTLDDVAAFLPKDFSRSFYRTSTTGPLTKRPKIPTTIDDVESFLPKDFKGYRTSTPASDTTRRTKLKTTLEDVESFLPKDYPKSNYRNPVKRPLYITSTTLGLGGASTERSSSSTKRKDLTTIEDISAFLPPGYKLKKEDANTEKPLILSELVKNKLAESNSSLTTNGAKSISDLLKKSAVNISALLPANYNIAGIGNSTSTAGKPEDPIQELLKKSSVNISALLPTGYKPDATNSSQLINSSGSSDAVEHLLKKSKVDISALLPPGFEANGNSARQEEPAGAKSATTNGSNSFKVVFPSRPGGRKSIHKTTTPAANRGGGEPASPRIQKGWPTRVTTEFTGWPTSSTTPISIEKLLEAARTATISSVNVSSHHPTISEVTSTPSTTTTTTTTLKPTTPGICEEDCEVAGTIKIIENTTWVPELLNRNTREWQDLAEEIERELNLVFAKSPVLRKWFRTVHIDSFSQGSILVDYFVQLADVKEKINTQQLKVIFHDSLRSFSFDDPMDDKSKGPLKFGKFTIDPKCTDFVVIPKAAAPKMIIDENRLIPQWAIAVIVIGVGGLLFIVIFGVSVLMNRQHGSKLKPSITAMYEEEVSKNVINHATPSSRPVSEYQKNESQTMWNDSGWHDKPFESTSHKILVDGLPYERKYNMYDSWKSEWNGYYYPPSQNSGSKFSRHHPHYDINF